MQAKPLLHIYAYIISEKNKENIQPNQFSTAVPQILMTLPDKTEQEIILEKTTQTNGSWHVSKNKK